MTRVDFYVLADNSHAARLELVCKLAEKACGRAQKVFVYSQERALLEDLDARLWSFRPMSFIAHRLLPQSHLLNREDDDPLLLSSDEPGSDRQILLNLDSRVPPFFSRFERTLEIVNKDTDVQAAGRKRYLFYKQRGYPLQHHNL